MSFKLTNDVFDFVLSAFKVIQFGHITFVSQLFSNEMNSTTVINDIVISVDEPARRVHFPQIFVYSVSISILEDYRFIFLIVIKIAKAFMRVEIVSLKSIRKRKLNSVIAKADEIAIHKYNIECIS